MSTISLYSVQFSLAAAVLVGMGSSRTGYYSIPFFLGRTCTYCIRGISFPLYSTNTATAADADEEEVAEG